VVVTALYSDLGQDRIVAFVVREGPLTVTAVAETCRRALGWKAPKNVFFVKSLPRNAAGKVLRRELRKFIRQQPRSL
jgi:acyl-CoA synthetase (AMP-forming)/AMP-acid ligase II